tara:strand:- start:85 stop:771 length:687 start_codon:yes stop_codon:yes gene_type:complete
VITLKQYPKCTKCELHEQAKSVGMKTHLHSCIGPDQTIGNYSFVGRKILVIGQNPGWNEDRVNQPFVGRSGEILKKAYFGGVNLTSKCSIWLSNGVRCHTTNNQTPKPRHYVECNQYLIEDLQHIRPQYVLTLGAPATTSFYKNILGIPKISLSKSFGLNGNLYTEEEHKIDGVGEFNLFSTYHPAAVIRNNNHINSVHSHMQLLSDCIDGTMASPSKPNIISTRSPK